MTTTAFKAWMSQATTEQQEELAASLKTSRKYLYQLSVGPPKGRAPSAEMGGEIERQTKRMSKQGLPIVLRTETVPACAACEYARACLKGK